MRADWTASGACTSGSTAPRGGATRGASGGAATTSTTRAERDADVRTDVARRGSIAPHHVGRDDGADDAALPGPDAVALPPGRPRPDDLARGRGLFRRLDRVRIRSEEHTSELQSRLHLVCRLLLEKKKNK